METEDKKLTEEEFLRLAECCFIHQGLYRELTGTGVVGHRFDGVSTDIATLNLFILFDGVSTFDGKPCFNASPYPVILVGDDFKNPLGIVPCVRYLKSSYRSNAFKRPLGLVEALAKFADGKDDVIRTELIKIYNYNKKFAGCKDDVIRTLDGTPVNGVLRTYHSNRLLASETVFSEGKKCGIEYKYHSNGKLSSKTVFRDDKECGVAYSYYEDGSSRSENDYDNDTSKSYYSSGVLSHIRQGKNRKEYYENSILKEEYSSSLSVDGKEILVTKIYYENGRLKNEFMSKAGKLDGIERSYYENGVLKTEQPYENGKREGIRKTYYANGVLETEHPYKNGRRNGNVMKYDENGTLEFEIPFENGIHGTAKSHYKDATLRFERIPASFSSAPRLRYYKNDELRLDIQTGMTGMGRFYA
ncbi:hypothetical protein RsTz2092_00780 [Deferribacterales bacterium RsTz2092]|nr:hypothetical protein AGMMS49941_00680 [Deferribacterales bacterium]